MKRLLLLIALLSALPASAQVAMRLNVAQHIFLQYDRVFVKIDMRNVSAHPLTFGTAEGLHGEIDFEISRQEGGVRRFVRKREGDAAPDMTGTIIQPGGSTSLVYDLSKYYDVSQPGNYTVKAVLRHPKLISAYESNAGYFSVTPGTVIWEATVGLPVMEDVAGKDEKGDVRKIKTRRYRILKYNTGTKTYYVMRIDDSGRIYRQKPIGFDLGKDLEPQCRIDFLSRLNLLVAASPKVFAFYQYNPDGKLEKKQVYIKNGPRPTFSVDPETGVVTPVGGRTAIKDVDYEEIRNLPFMEDMGEGKDVFSKSRDALDALGDKTSSPDSESARDDEGAEDGGFAPIAGPESAR